VSNSAEGWCALGNLRASRVSICMDNWRDGQRDDGTDDETHGFKGSFILPLLYVIINNSLYYKSKEFITFLGD
jgi:hypothetical protein